LYCLFQLLVDWLEVDGVFLITAVFVVVKLVYVFFYLPEFYFF